MHSLLRRRHRRRVRDSARQPDVPTAVRAPADGLGAGSIIAWTGLPLLCQYMDSAAATFRHRACGSFSPMMRRFQAFTLIELLVAIAIVATLMALLLPAVQQAREAARRTQCRNNLRQLGIAFQNYHDSHSTLPPGFIAQQEFPGASHLNQFGWGAMLLPALDQAPLYQRFAFDRLSWDGAGSGSNLAGGQTPLSVFRCPSDVGPERIDRSCPGIPGPEVAVSNYAGVEGMRGVPLPCWDQSSMPGMGTAFFHYPPGQCSRADGSLYLNSRVRLTDITDGTSHTFLAGETSAYLNRKECLDTFIIPMLTTTPYHGVSWAGTYQSYHSEHVVLTTSREFNDRDRNGVSHGFSSLHAGGAFFLMGDGHVRFVADTIDNNPQSPQGVFQHLSTIRGGEVVGGF